MTTVVTRGAASAQALGYASSSAAVTYIEDVFSTYLDLADGANTIVNGINLSTYGGLVWHKTRSAAYGHDLRDSARGFRYGLESNSTGAQFDSGASYFTANTNGFFDAYDSGGNTDVWWTFREQPKFFDVVTYTGNGADSRTIAHSLGSEPGFVIIKRTDSTSNWVACNFQYSGNWIFNLNSTSARKDSGSTWLTSSTNVTIWSYAFMDSADRMNLSGASYVAYFFAHNAGGFGLTGTDNVISCGSFTTDASGVATVNLGYEPQWILMKDIAAANWQVFDVMRGQPVTGGSAKFLRPNTSDAESNQTTPSPNATGFSTAGSGPWGDTVTRIYIAIRRGPMQVPTSGTSVFTPVLRNGTGSNATVTSAGGVVDLVIPFIRDGSAVPNWFDRLRGRYLELRSNGTNPENSYSDTLTGFDVMTGFSVGADAGGFGVNTSGQSIINWAFRRAPGFFDEVCYTGTGVARTVTHNLAAVPELMIVKSRSGNGQGWHVYAAPLGNNVNLYLSLTLAENTPSGDWNTTSPTSSVFTVGAGGYDVNNNGSTYVAYLFATLAGVSKCGSYTGTGTTQTINCGFTAGARFILIKRTDSTGDWYVWDSARGIIAGNDPYLLLNSTAAEVTGTDYVDTAASGFEISSTAPAAINANGGSFIFLAIA